MEYDGCFDHNNNNKWNDDNVNSPHFEFDQHRYEIGVRVCVLFAPLFFSMSLNIT